MRYKIIDLQVAGELARKTLEGESTDFSDHEHEVGKGVALSDSVLEGIAKEIRKHQAALDKSGASREALDSLAFEPLHKMLPQDPDMVGDPRFWCRFALVYLFDVIRWRFPGKGAKGFNLVNLGIGASRRMQVENYLYKLWMRADLSRVPGEKDPYRLGRLGSIDFWTSHIHRQGFTNSRDFTIELIKFQYPSEMSGKPRLFPGEEDLTKGKVGVRTLVKRLRRLWATVEYTLLHPEEARGIIQELSKGLSTADGKSVYS